MESEDTPPSNFSKEEIKILQKSTLVSIVISTSGNVVIVPVCLLVVRKSPFCGVFFSFSLLAAT